MLYEVAVMAPLDTLLDTLYAAPTSPLLWSDVLESCIDLVGADSGWVNELDRRDRFAGSGFVQRVDPREQDRYFDYYASLDPFRIDATSTPAALEMCGDEYFIPKDNLVRSEFYSDFMSPIRVHSILILRMFDDGRVTRSMHLNYDKRGEWQASSGWRDLQIAFPHLKRAAALSREMKKLSLANAALSVALDKSTGGVILLDRRGKVCFSTEAGAALLRRGDCLTFKQGRVRATRTADTAELQKLVTLATDGTRSFRQGGCMHLPVPGRSMPMIVAVSPLGEASQRDDEPTAILTIRDPAASIRPSDRVLSTSFGLTPAERRVAVTLAAGSSPRQIATDLSLSYNTVRNHLKQIYGKVDVSRQSDLVTKLLKLGFSDAADE